MIASSSENFVKSLSLNDSKLWLNRSRTIYNKNKMVKLFLNKNEFIEKISKITEYQILRLVRKADGIVRKRFIEKNYIVRERIVKNIVHEPQIVRS